MHLEGACKHMSVECQRLHDLMHSLERHYFPFDDSKIPENGIYILFEKGEMGHRRERIVRIGTHTGYDQLRSRLHQHFLAENKDRSIFRKNIGRALLKKQNDSFLNYWEIDLTTRAAKAQYSGKIDLNYQNQVEQKVSEYIRNSFSFGVFEIAEKTKRLELESKLISTISWCNECKQSEVWLGNYSPKKNIVKSGLWLVNELYKTPLTYIEINDLSNFI